MLYLYLCVFLLGGLIQTLIRNGRSEPSPNRICNSNSAVRKSAKSEASLVPARSGMLLKNRAGLKQLMKDVMDGQLEFRAVLVYDESRWGRFQDTDEAAHYEYLCKSSTIPVHYCAEPFLNDNSTFANIVKALKRSMAAEYSRELSTKVRAGMVRLATRGYSLGGMPGYGWRRQLLDAQGSPKQLLMEGERKSIAIERIVLVPGPREEVAVVARIFHELVDDHS